MFSGLRVCACVCVCIGVIGETMWPVLCCALCFPFLFAIQINYHTENAKVRPKDIFFINRLVYWWRSMNERVLLLLLYIECRWFVSVYVWKYYTIVNCIHSNRMRIFIFFSSVLYINPLICGACLCVIVYAWMSVCVCVHLLINVFSSSFIVLDIVFEIIELSMLNRSISFIFI